MPKLNSITAARHALQMLSASDPVAQSSMVRYDTALSLIFAGRRNKNMLEGEPDIIATFQTTPEERSMLMAVTWRLQRDHVVLAFDIDDPAGPPVGLAVFSVEGMMV